MTMAACRTVTTPERVFLCLIMSGLRFILILLLISFAVSSAHASPQIPDVHDDGTKPIHVFVLAGQSNMVGMGNMKHLDMLVQNCSCPHNMYRSTLWNETSGTYKVRENVYVKFEDAHGQLTVNKDFAAQGHFGPELLFGWVLGDHYVNETVFLVKTAFGGRTLAVDFRPPSSGEGDFEGVKPSHYGWEYRAMVDEINEALENIETYVPTSDGSYEIEGFVWFQGWNDLLDWPFVKEYESNLVNLLADIRKELNISDLPAIVGELGMHTLNCTGPGCDRVHAMRASQYFATVMDDYTSFVPTAPFAHVTGAPLYGGIHHYYERADTYFKMGQAFGQAMVNLLNNKAEDAAASRKQTPDAAKIKQDAGPISWIRRGWESVL